MTRPAQERHWHWMFLAFNHDDPEPTGNIQWAVEVSVIGYLCEADARIAAKDIIERGHFRLVKVWECNTCGFQATMAGAITDLVDVSR